MCTGKTREENVREENGHNINNQKHFRPFIIVYGEDPGRKYMGNAHNVNNQKRFRPFINVYGAAREKISGKNSHNINSWKRFRPFLEVYGEDSGKNIREETGRNRNSRKRFRPFTEVYGEDSGRRYTGRKTHNINSRRCFRLLDVYKKEQAIGVREAQQYKEPKSLLSAMCVRAAGAGEVNRREANANTCCRDWGQFSVATWAGLVLSCKFGYWQNLFRSAGRGFFCDNCLESVLRRSCFENSYMGWLCRAT